MFRFGYGQYMQHAFPRDDLRPISCRGRDSQGGIALTLIDSLDTLVVGPRCGTLTPRLVLPCWVPSRRMHRMLSAALAWHLACRPAGRAAEWLAATQAGSLAMVVHAVARPAGCRCWAGPSRGRAWSSWHWISRPTSCPLRPPPSAAGDGGAAAAAGGGALAGRQRHV